MTIERDDLSARSRRGELDAAGEKQLALWLATSQEASLVHRAGLAFDAEDSVLAGDEALAQRIAERVLAARPVPLAPRPAWLKPALGAGGVVVALALLGPFAQQRFAGTRQTTAASASHPAHTQPSTRIDAPLAPSRATPSAAQPAREATNSSSDSPLRPTPTQPRPSPRTDPENAAAAPLDSAKHAAAPASESASELFSRANRARRESQTELAISLYRRLQQHYPGSPEALSAEMALGMLELKASHAQAAHRHFSAYLERSPDGGLAPEALWGQAQALSSLGRSAQAADSLRLLLKRFPGSAYASAARAKLEAAP